MISTHIHSSICYLNAVLRFWMPSSFLCKVGFFFFLLQWSQNPTAAGRKQSTRATDRRKAAAFTDRWQTTAGCKFGSDTSGNHPAVWEANFKTIDNRQSVEYVLTLDTICVRWQIRDQIKVKMKLLNFKWNLTKSRLHFYHSVSVCRCATTGNKIKSIKVFLFGCIWKTCLHNLSLSDTLWWICARLFSSGKTFWISSPHEGVSRSLESKFLSPGDVF